jgi:hypothetical protein
VFLKCLHRFQERVLHIRKKLNTLETLSVLTDKNLKGEEQQTFGLYHENCLLTYIDTTFIFPCFGVGKSHLKYVHAFWIHPYVCLLHFQFRPATPDVRNGTVTEETAASSDATPDNKDGDDDSAVSTGPPAIPMCTRHTVTNWCYEHHYH